MFWFRLKLKYLISCSVVLLSAAQAAAVPAQAAERWESIPMVSKENLDAGSRGGEGGQWCHSLEIDRVSGKLLFYGTNTGGVYRSGDAGQNWVQVNRGLSATGASAFAIDPVNVRNVLALGIGTRADHVNGIYYSMDMGDTWQQVLSLPLCGNKYYLDGLEYDRSSYNGELGRCLRAYCSTPYEEDSGTKLADGTRGLYRSDDGGISWGLVNGWLSDAVIKTDPDDGTVYAARKDGLFVSRNLGVDFEKAYDGEVRGFDADWDGKVLYLRGRDGLYSSRDGGSSFQKIKSSSFPHGKGSLGGFAVSPADPQDMVVQSDNDIYYSHNGGKDWDKWSYDDGLDFLPFNNRDKLFAWSVSDKSRVFSFGGDFMISSQDGGKKWKWDSNGICGMLCGGRFHFNVYNPRILYLASQDYNGALTTDGGKTWSYVNLSGKDWGGFAYGGYAASPKLMYAGVSDGWDSTKHLKITFDGGKHVKDTGRKFSGMIYRDHISSYQSPVDPDVLFAANLFSTDGGKNWKEMDGCLQVYTHNPGGDKELYGCEPGSGFAVVSYDQGRTWNRVAQDAEIPVSGDYPYLTELALDEKQGRLYAAANQTQLFAIDLNSGHVEELTGNLPVDQKGERRVGGIAVDPDRGLLYVSGEDDRYNRTSAVLCSEDAGMSFHILSSQPETPVSNGFGGYSPHCIRVNPLTGDLWCASGCYGLQKYVKDSDNR